MRKVKMYISFLLFLFFTSSQVKAEEVSKAQDIPVYKKGAHLGARTTEPSVTASLEDETLTVNVSHYLGVAKVYVYDTYGNLMINSSVLIEGDGGCTLDLSAFDNGSYNVTVELGDIVYWGMLVI